MLSLFAPAGWIQGNYNLLFGCGVCSAHGNSTFLMGGQSKMSVKLLPRFFNDFNNLILNTSIIIFIIINLKYVILMTLFD